MQDSLSEQQKKTALRVRPSILEVAAHTYFPASFMVGPQFSMRRYLDFVHVSLIKWLLIIFKSFFFLKFKNYLISILIQNCYPVLCNCKSKLIQFNSNLINFQGNLFKDTVPPSLMNGFLRGSLGIFYISVYQIGTYFLPEAFLTTAEYFVSVVKNQN